MTAEKLPPFVYDLAQAAFFDGWIATEDDQLDRDAAFAEWWTAWAENIATDFLAVRKALAGAALDPQATRMLFEHLRTAVDVTKEDWGLILLRKSEVVAILKEIDTLRGQIPRAQEDDE